MRMPYWIDSPKLGAMALRGVVCPFVWARFGSARTDAPHGGGAP
ncbi:MAG: hypothetical protein ACRENB_03760 [Gemmatimonadales bacterium]